MIDELNKSLNLIVEKTISNTSYLLYVLFIIWGVYFLSRLIPAILLLGIIPRRLYGLPGIFFAPFLHLNFNHIFFNTIPLIVLSNFILINGFKYFLEVTLFITIISGILTWLFARSAIHIGASSVITGYWALLVMNSYEHANLTSIILAVTCIYYFIGIFLGVFPREKGVSWEGHLFGLIAGFGTSYYFYYLNALL